MVGMPSRAHRRKPPSAQGAPSCWPRHGRQEAISGYSGIRIDSQGRRFRIESARLWTVRNAQRCGCAQAACFFPMVVALSERGLPAGDWQGVRFSVLAWRVRPTEA